MSDIKPPSTRCHRKFIDARKDDLKEISCDICIIGAGAAGITIARSLSQQDIRICLLESGGLAPAPATQSLYSGAVTGEPYYPLEATGCAISGARPAIGAAPEPELEKERILNTWMGFKLNPTPASHLADSWDAIKSQLRQGELPYDFSRHVKIILKSIRQLYRDLQEENDHPDELVTIPVGQQSEQPPNPLSRVKLTAKA